jgi:hypothetical protein
MDWLAVTQLHSIDLLYNRFISIILDCIHQCIPTKTITLKNDPVYITPVIKGLLVMRYRLGRRSKTTQANSLAEKINLMIANVQNSQLKKACQFHL